MSQQAYAAGLERNPANFTALSPLTFLRKAAQVHPQRVALVHGERRLTWADEDARCRRLASALQRWGVGRGDTVAAMQQTRRRCSSCITARPCSARCSTRSIRA